MIKPKSVTLDDVAKHAGVSYQTVSRVINQAPHVSSRTRAKVEQAMLALNYVPNRVAQQLAGKNQITLGLATVDLSMHAESQIAAAIKRQASDRGVSVVISMLQEKSVQSCVDAVNELLSHRVDGLLINVSLDDGGIQTIARMCVNTAVLFFDVDPQAEVASIRADNPDLSTRQGAEHLIELGHRRIALITGPLTDVSAQLRYHGWVGALASHGLHPCAVVAGNWNAESGFHAALQLLNGDTRPTAILVANDQMSLGVLRAAHEFGLHIPAQLSVVGYDDAEDSAYFYPPLTTIQQDFKKLGQESVNRIISMIQQPEVAHQRTMLATRLIVRRSSGKISTDALSLQQIGQQLLTLSRQLEHLK